MGIKNEQIIICKKYNTEIYPVSDVSKIGVAENVKQTGLYPINGLSTVPKVILTVGISGPVKTSPMIKIFSCPCIRSICKYGDPKSSPF